MDRGTVLNEECTGGTGITRCGRAVGGEGGGGRRGKVGTRVCVTVYLLEAAAVAKPDDFDDDAVIVQ